MKIVITHDGPLDIAIGESRGETHWKNTEMQFSALANKLSKTHRTHETYKKFMAAERSLQDKWKDVGGYVLGYLANGKRRKGSVTRNAVTLDADFVTGDIWDDFILQFSCAAVIHSTHKHCPDKQRLRLIIPLNREVSPDEYQAIARKIAGVLGIDQFDHTTFQPERLMYWPSTSSDGEYVFKYNDDAWLSADEVLNSYHNWQDISEWPMCASEKEIVNPSKKKQEDPLLKDGLVGAFCRSHTMQEGIELFLPDVYESTDTENRYTFIGGSTYAGLIVYEDKFAYSHHATDPVSGKQCNVWDLVRIHKFGLKDEDAKPDTPVNRLPSHIAMEDFARKDHKTKIQLAEDRHNQALNDFTDDSNTDVDNSWEALLDVDRKGNYYSTIDNIVIILENDPELKKKYCYDRFAQREVITDKDGIRIMQDADDANLRHYLEKHYGISSVNKIGDALKIVVMKNSFHPVTDYLDKLTWDKKKRVGKLLIEYMGAEDNDYTRAVIRKALCAAVARVYNPGVKFDYMLILIGLQGQGKSTLIAKLGKQWFSDSFNFHMLQTKQGEEQIQGCWLMESGELAGLKKAEIERVKSFLTRTEDRYRVAYGKRVSYFPRQCIFIGSTNDHTPLQDQSGNRRFWPVTTDPAKATKSVFTDLTSEEVDQLWAEAKHLYDRGEELFLSKELEEQALKVQATHTEHDDSAGIIEEFLERLIPENWYEMSFGDRRSFPNYSDDFRNESNTTFVKRDKVCVAEIWYECFGNALGTLNHFNTKRYHDIMRNMSGWKVAKSKQRFPSPYGVQQCYERIKKSVATSSKLAATNRKLAATNVATVAANVAAN